MVPKAPIDSGRVYKGLTVNRLYSGRSVEIVPDSVVTGGQFHNGGRVLVMVGASAPLEGLAGSAIGLMMFTMAHVGWHGACAVFYRFVHKYLDFGSSSSRRICTGFYEASRSG